MLSVVRNEKTFKYYTELLPEIRIIVVDSMEPEDRCRLTRCSKWCYKEAKSSKNYLYGLRFYGHMSCVTIEVEIDNFGNGFKLKFGRESGQNCMIYENTRNRKCSKTKLENSINMVYYGTEHFKNLLKYFQNTVKALHFSGEYPNNFNLGITSLKSLKKLEVYGDFDLSQIFSKLRNPLKELLVDATENSQVIEDYKEVYQVQNSLTLYEVDLNYEQFLRISAKNVKIPIGELTALDFFKFLRSWRNSWFEETKKIGSYRWRRDENDFNKRWLIERLGVEEEDVLENGDIKIRHNYDDRKFGKFFSNRYELGFDVLDDDDDEED